MVKRLLFVYQCENVLCHDDVCSSLLLVPRRRRLMGRRY